MGEDAPQFGGELVLYPILRKKKKQKKKKKKKKKKRERAHARNIACACLLCPAVHNAVDAYR